MINPNPKQICLYPSMIHSNPRPKKTLEMINPNPKQTCLDPSITHSNPKMIAAVMKNTATRTVAGAQARVTETEE